MKQALFTACRPVTRILAAGTFLIVLTAGFISCGTPSSDPKTAAETAAPEQAGEFTMRCFRIDSSLVKAWKDSGWLAPGAGTTNRILLQLTSDKPANLNTNMSLRAFPARSNSDAIGTGTALVPDTTCEALKITKPVSFTNNFIKLSDLNIVKPGGELISFDYILLKPSVTNYPPYLNFDVSVIRNAAPESLSGKGSWPCPVYCF